MNNSISVVLDFADPHGGEPTRRKLTKPVRVLCADSVTDVRAVLDDAHRASEEGAWCVGYVRYEAAPAFDAAYRVHDAPKSARAERLIHDSPALPLAWFAVFEATEDGHADTGDVAVDSGYGIVGDWQEELTVDGFEAGMAEIGRAIRDGENYQINYTMRLRATFEGHARLFFDALRRSQPDSYAAFIDTGSEQVLSVSPELFFDWRDGHLLSRPMKGTAARGATAEDDRAQADYLRANEKERAENLMIVDLIRNDLSRVALPHSVKVPRLFETRAWPTVWQMTSDVVARSRPGTRLSDVFEALFPCGSVVGVPKVKAMERIHALEASPRGVYCGATGVLRPGGAVTFNVAIRTVVIDGQGNAQCGVGSGVTSDAQAASEWREWRQKWSFLRTASQPFELLETVLLDQGRLPLADDHLDRMARAAAHFSYPWGPRHRERAHALLAEQAQQHPHGSWRVRLLLDAYGNLSVQSVSQPALPGPLTVELASRALAAASDDFVRFKTTRRAHYDALAPVGPGVFDSLLWNEQGEVTEFTRGNVLVKLDGRWLTPPLRCGLLGGVGRARVLADGLPVSMGDETGQPVSEAVVTLDDLARAEGLAFVNSCRGCLPVRLVQLN